MASSHRLVFLLVLALFLGCAVATEKYVSDTGSDTEGDGSEESPYQTIAKAIDETDEIVVMGGILSTTNAGNMNLEVSKKSITIRGASDFKPTIIDLNKNGGFITVTDSVFLSIANLDFRRGSKNVIAATSDSGFDLIVDNCAFNQTVMDKSATVAGGAISVVTEGDTEVTITGSSFFSNSNAQGSGAALYVKSDNVTTIKISGSSMSDNTASSSGGAIYVDVPLKSTVELECDHSSQLYQNNVAGSSSGSMDMGGVMYVTGELSDDANENELYAVDVSIRGCTYGDNEAVYGGGAFAVLNANLKMFSTTCIDNKVTGDEREGRGGGAVYVDGGSFETDEECFFVRNQGPYGGALLMKNGKGGTINKASWDDNKAEEEGMQVYVHSFEPVTFELNDFSCQEDYCDPEHGAIVVGKETIVNMNDVYHPSSTNVTHLDSMYLYPYSKVFFESYTNPTSASLEIFKLTVTSRATFAPNAPLTIADHGQFLFEGGTIASEEVHNLTLGFEATLTVENSTYISDLPNYDIVVGQRGTMELKSQMRVGHSNSERSLTFEYGAALLVDGEGILLHAKNVDMQSGSQIEVATFKELEDKPLLYTELTLDSGAQLKVNVVKGEYNGAYFETMCFNGGRAYMNASDDAVEKGKLYLMADWDESVCSKEPSAVSLVGNNPGYDDVSFSVNTTALYMVASSKSNDGLGGGAVFGIILAVFVAVGLVAGGVWYYLKKRGDGSYDELAGGTEREYGTTFDYQNTN